MQLTRLFLVHIVRVFLILICCVFPMLYLCDLAFTEIFSPLYALAKLPLRYGQALNILLLWSVWIGVKSMRRTYSDNFFITIGFLPRKAYRVWLVIAASFMALDAFILIPSNGWILPEKVMVTNWSLQNVARANNADVMHSMFVHKNDKKIELWYVGNEVACKEFALKDLSVQHDKRSVIVDDSVISLSDDDFFILWNEPRKMSFGGLHRCREYMKHHGLDTSDLDLQWHVYLSRIFLLFSVTIVGFALGWRKGVKGILICSVATTWIGEMLVFLPTKIGIIVSWLNVVLWMVLGCVLL